MPHFLCNGAHWSYLSMLSEIMWSPRAAPGHQAVSNLHHRVPLPPAPAAQWRHERQVHCLCTSAAEMQRQSPVVQLMRRRLLLGGLLLAGAATTAAPPSSRAEAASSGGSADGLALFSNPGQGYSLLRPMGWEQVNKAGADSFFREPSQKSTNVGVTVYPVMIASLNQFGDLQAVGERLLVAEKAKESTQSVTMVAQSVRSAAGAPVYDFEYELESTRGRKRILSTVTIAGGKLYISNGNISCSKKSCSGEEQQLSLVRRVTQSLAVSGLTADALC